MIRQCILCRHIYDDYDSLEDAKLSGILILCNSCYLQLGTHY